MGKKLKDIFVQSGIEILCFAAAGILLLGYFVVVPNNTGFSYTIFGLSAVIFYQLMINKDKKSFILLGLLFSLLMVIVFKLNNHVLVLFRNFCWFIAIGLMIYFLGVIEKKEWYGISKLWPVAAWFLGFVLVYLFMTTLNIYVFKFYRTGSRISAISYLTEAVKIGGILGISIGAGNLIGTFFVNKKTAGIKI